MRRRETPAKRITNGKVRWVARWTTKDGRRLSAGTFDLKRDAQDAIDAAYEAEEAGPVKVSTLGEYFATWTENHPRGERTNRTNKVRITAVLDVELEGVALRNWRYDQIRRRHAVALVTHLLVEQGRAYTGAQGILSSLSAMTEDAITDEIAELNAWRGVKVRANDPRIQKPVVPKRVFSWERMHAFAAECGRGTGYGATVGEPMARVLSDCGLRAGELLGLYRADLDVQASTLHVCRTVNEHGELEAGTKEDRLRGRTSGEGRFTPVPPDLLAMLLAMPKRIDTPLLFPTLTGRIWHYANWRAHVWDPAQERAGFDPTPHEFRHSFASLQRAAGVDPADLAQAMGHTVLTATTRYTHALGRSDDAIRAAVGA